MKLFTIPNLLTLANLLCGSLAIMFLTGQFGGTPEYVSFWILILLCASLLFDLLDGMVARALKINSEIGLQLDSLADMVSFGVVPGLLMYKAIEPIQDISFLKYAGFFIILFSALRLAKFNVDTTQTSYFKGLATPANTILVFSLYWIIVNSSNPINPHYSHILALLSPILGWLLVSNIPLFSFKLKGFGWKENDFIYIFLIVSVILLILFQITAVPFIILLYIIVSIIFRKKIINA